ncbi:MULTISPECIES: sodium:alanine symporter family protein [unclassified Ruegeria]|uniref:alanine/glycine:cation symporter family protein n=1 Tax=unclassified Ruegeria TaxID=2625375 RepID=UPI00148A0104|nr:MULTISPECIES: sodium:alanine symporter family protein [unclassified Ruegeria]NOD64746.1 amino acid carrier protein [Ruegeria sp. HKCCD6109]NOD77742.1 amino acid carrier protein [Ruegeria sp. HKCCD4332]NOD89950.1 amino acid carrier protein [Ruegeria sp. HKCCD4318]NOD95301.1 amino acid carrier protein [Ruegeria sp. HKCCD4884]NOE14604.1 amino acid carrier protein [Ruegeria sp. HKCCD4318-2]
MEALTSITGAINGVVWGPWMLALILGVGFFLQVGLKFMPILRIGTGFSLLFKGREGQGEGQISPFNALMTSLSATIGTGNIAGVATAVFLGGPGALFWMWMTALVGMATKYAEAVCAVKYREKDELGNYVGGPMYYIKNGLGAKWAWLGVAFALFGGIAAFGIGNGVQANGVAQVLETNFGINESITGIVLMILTAAVILGGITRIGAVAGKLVPFMAIAYIVAGLLVLLINIGSIGAALSDVFTYAFTPWAAKGGAAGAAVWLAIRFGVARGVFSNEAGLGSAPIAHAAAETKGPVNQGLIAMLGTFIDTIIVCSITGLAIIASGALDASVADFVANGETEGYKAISGAALTSLAFETTLPGIGGYLIAIALSIFAFTTILGWSFYGEKCVEFLLGVKSLLPYRILWIVAIYFGATADLGFVWLLADTLNAMMAIPNLIALALLSPIVFKLTKEFFASNGQSEEPGGKAAE